LVDDVAAPAGAVTGSSPAAGWPRPNGSLRSNWCTTALAEYRDPEVVEYTRWAFERRGEQRRAGLRRPGVDRLVVGTTSTDLNEQLRQLEATPPFTACDAERRRGTKEPRRNRPVPGWHARVWIANAEPMPARWRPSPENAWPTSRASQQTNRIRASRFHRRKTGC